MEILIAHRERPIPSIGDQRPDVPPAIDDVFGLMVAKRPTDRYQSMHDVIVALQAAANSDAQPATAEQQDDEPILIASVAPEADAQPSGSLGGSSPAASTPSSERLPI